MNGNKKERASLMGGSFFHARIPARRNPPLLQRISFRRKTFRGRWSSGPCFREKAQLSELSQSAIHLPAGRERRLYADGLPDTFSDAGAPCRRFPLSEKSGKSVIFLFIRKISEWQGISFLPGLLRGAAVWLFCFGCLYYRYIKEREYKE